ncbi:RelE/StbE replicon stabilization toxin [Microcystis sp. 0824]|jgi:Txe/YoeB family toxin of toxin-antitoxin system|uniref:Endoribonuclease YoeB n=2 Tax=Microcystis aeruginosa TaxID=1126 RepID=I4IL75_MICAE|nr:MULTISPECIES: Txe/YoeB family addiction module toxin [Bacteria]MCZ8056881.1 Txe/YoeB family addiction module toxin [Microcystis sp. LE19-12.2C]MDJ0547823.1 Txe/YoeB family addiction module toxin [Microcystis sp. M49637_WE12]NCQ86557.1 Txe/YoeB family addiction module toxin [Microcystis aeruginosa W13-18]NCR35741.1 Txe/YoeB family addiction module toxin [Microcystis aeruginosa S11-05]NCR49262.1 Txe/YoeB family addiction module toxin [Microcystis aeruginosa S11-01]NCS00381.1 Txe/YoeB family 
MAKVILKDKVLMLLKQLEKDIFQPPFEKLVGDLKGKYSRHLNIQHRLVYRLDKTAKIFKILKAYEHY